MRAHKPRKFISSLLVFGSLLLPQLPSRFQFAAAPIPSSPNTQAPEAFSALNLSNHHKQIKPASPLMPIVPTVAMGVRTETEGKSDDIYGKLPLSFEANEGQTAEEVRFLSRGPGYVAFFTAAETVLVLREQQQNYTSEAEKKRQSQMSRGPSNATSEIRRNQENVRFESRSVLRMRLAGTTSEAVPTGVNELAGKTNYFVGNKPSKWRTGIRSYAGIKYSNVYPGIDLVYYGNGKHLEFDFVVAPGADTNAIQMSFEGADDIEIDTAGNLVIKVASQSLKLRKPTVYQDIEGVRKEVVGTYNFDVRSRAVGFDLASFDPKHPLVIDPVLEYSTFLGGTGGDVGVGIAVDVRGSAYITGQTTAIDFPTTRGVFQPTSLYDDAFVLKLSPDGSALEYATYLGGSDLDWAVAIALDASGNAYVTGETFSGDFPTTPGAFQQTCRPSASTCWPGVVFVTKLNSSGTALFYSSYLGGAFQTPAALGFSRPGGIAVDGVGYAYVTGQVAAADFPTTPGAFQTAWSGAGDAFVTKFAPDGTSLIYSTYLGGSREDHGLAITTDTKGHAYVTGYTGHPFAVNDFPTTSGSFQSAGSTEDAFVTKLNPAGTGLVYSTLLGGTQRFPTGGAEFDSGLAIAIDAGGSAYVAGKTWTTDFPTVNPPDQLNKPLTVGSHSFISKLKSDGSGLVYSTYLAPGGAGGVAVDSNGNAYVAGSAAPQVFPFDPHWFPFVNRLPSNFGENGDAFVLKLDSSGSIIRYATTLGDWFVDYASAIAVDGAGNAYITGLAASPKFPITHSLLPLYLSGGGAFVGKIVETARKADLSVALSGKLRQTANREIQTIYSITVRNDGPHEAERVTLDERVFIHHYPTTLLEYGATQGDCRNLNGRIFCELGRIVSGQSVSVIWVVTTTTPIMPITVRSATAEDPEPANNSASLETWDLSGQHIWVSNSGSGKVVSNPPGIDCTNNYQTCIHYYEAGSVITLTALPGVGHKLQQWSGICSGSGTGPCTIRITGRLRDGYINTGAQFELINPNAITFDSPTSSDAEVGVPFTDASIFQGGVPPYNVQVVRGSLPPGLQIDSDYGLTGVPTKSGKFTFTLQVIDWFGKSATKAFRMQVYPALIISTGTLKAGTVGRKYNFALKTAGGKKPYNWSIATGGLPPGLTFNTTKAAITGKPEQTGTFTLTIQVMDPLGGTVKKHFTLIIN